jgi:hypothetical protein
MGISNVAVKTFDSTGSQSLCRTNEYKGDEEVKSSFISKCQKMYISGSGETVIPGSLRTFPTLNSVDTFYVNSDTDAISDITFNVEFKLKRHTGTGTWNANVAKDIVLALIDKVEIKLGSLTVQTLTSDDIFIRNLTELGKPFSFSAPIATPRRTPLTENYFATPPLALLEQQEPKGYENVWKYRTAGESDTLKIQAACSIPFIGRSNDVARSLLQAGALTNALTVKVYYNEIYKDNATAGNSHFQILSAGDNGLGKAGETSDFLDTSYFKSFIKVRTHIITETEKRFISKNIVHRIVNTSSSITKEINKNTLISSHTADVTDIEVDLENISFNVSHLLVGVKLPHVKDRRLSLHSGVTNAPSAVDLTKTYNNELPTPFSVINSQTFHKNTAATNSDALFGYMPDAIDSMELVVGSDRTGFISGVSAKIDTCENFNLVNSDNSAHYIITLAEKAFDTTGIAFSKCNNKKLLIKLNNDIFYKTSGVTPNPLSDNNFAQNALITVTACGTKVQSVVGGSMSFL